MVISIHMLDRWLQQWLSKVLLSSLWIIVVTAVAIVIRQAPITRMVCAECQFTALVYCSVHLGLWVASLVASNGITEAFNVDFVQATSML